MKIGVVVKKTGLTVRTLHHYDQIGLLKPSNETESGG
jgi:DNA-binding transcriptional MerR regulator